MKHQLLLAAGVAASVVVGSGFVGQANPVYDIWDFAQPTTELFVQPGFSKADQAIKASIEQSVSAAPPVSAPAQGAAASDHLQVTITSPQREQVPSIFALFQPAQRDNNGLESFFDPVTKVWVSYDPARATGEAAQRSNPIPREEIEFNSAEAPGTVIISTSERRLYYVLGQNRALRYGIGVGRDGFSWTGVKSVTRKAEWPDWRPPAEMIARRPDLPRFMPGGIANPLGARAMYLGSTLYRIHGSNEPGTIGQAVSSGCFRMTNDDVADLYDRVKVGAKVVVR